MHHSEIQENLSGQSEEDWQRSKTVICNVLLHIPSTISELPRKLHLPVLLMQGQYYLNKTENPTIGFR